MVEEKPDLDHLADQRYKIINYEFELVSSNVEKVTYQEGKKDQIIYKYVYDSDNRLHEAISSRDGINWDIDGKYFFYEHGPLARVEYGDNKVQGSDYYYTIQGWIKGVNSNALKVTADPGKDALVPVSSYTGAKHLNGRAARDAYGFNLNYYTTSTDNDYTAVKTYTANDINPMADVSLLASNSYFDMSAHAPSLFNGNISSMVTSIVDKDPGNAITDNQASPQITGYRYDQLQRLTQMKAYRNFTSSTNQWIAPTVSNYDRSYTNKLTYDANGNIESNIRYGAGPSVISGGLIPMDSLNYKYINVAHSATYNSNKLNFVSDDPAFNSNYTTDIDDQTALGNAYDYDPTGNLIQDKDPNSCIANIEWTIDKKVHTIERDASQLLSLGKNFPDIEYRYNAQRQRVIKIVKPRDNTTKDLLSQANWIYTYYNYDASGNVIAVYNREFSNPSTGNYEDKYDLAELDLYGSSRLGIIMDADPAIATRDFAASLDFNGLFTSIVYDDPSQGPFCSNW